MSSINSIKFTFNPFGDSTLSPPINSTLSPSVNSIEFMPLSDGLDPNEFNEYHIHVAGYTRTPPKDDPKAEEIMKKYREELTKLRSLLVQQQVLQKYSKGLSFHLAPFKDDKGCHTAILGVYYENEEGEIVNAKERFQGWLEQNKEKFEKFHQVL